jgi:biopolymer transport protein ExbD
MQPTAFEAMPLAGGVPHDLSIVALFLQSDVIVKVVMLILLLASFWSWAVIFDKVIRLRRLHHAAANFEESFWSGGSLDDLYERVGQRPPDPMTAVFSAAMREWRRSAAKGLLGTAIMRASLQQRIERVMNVTVGREMERVERFMAFLATVGASRSPPRRIRASRWWRRALPNHCSRPRSGLSPQSRRSSPTTSWRPISGALPGVSKPFPPNSARFCRASSTKGSRPVALSSLRGEGGRFRGRYRPMAEINVTPLVDVMPVLLVVFMVAAPLLTVGVPVDLPQTQAPPITDPKEPLVISINSEGHIFLQETDVVADSLVPRLQAITGENPDALVYVRADKSIDYGRVLEVMSLISAAGYRKVSLIAEAPKGIPGKAADALAAGRAQTAARH